MITGALQVEVTQAFLPLIREATENKPNVRPSMLNRFPDSITSMSSQREVARLNHSDRWVVF